jgi:hypothetical protein
MTPYEAAYRRKPDVSNLRIWGCTAYVHIQRDKRRQFQPRMEKCDFIGYPQGYKGWKFYNPITKRTIISERAEFDERYFPGMKQSTSEAYQFMDLQELSPPTTPESDVMELLGDDNDNPAPHIPHHFHILIHHLIFLLHLHLHLHSLPSIHLHLTSGT